LRGRPGDTQNITRILARLGQQDFDYRKEISRLTPEELLLLADKLAEQAVRRNRSWALSKGTAGLSLPS
jgi:hypothetical protein